MATKKPGRSIMMIVVAFLVLFSLVSMFRPVGAQLDVHTAWYFFDCMSLLHEDKSWVEEHPDYAFLLADSIRDQDCRDSLRSVQMSYITNGQLPREYVEGLQRWYQKNPTLVDIHICGLDFKRCSDETKALWGRYHDQHPQEVTEAPASSPN